MNDPKVIAVRTQDQRPVYAAYLHLSVEGRQVHSPVLDTGPLRSITRRELARRCAARFGHGIEVVEITPCRRFVLEGFGDVRDWDDDDRTEWFAFEDEIRWGRCV